MAAVLFVIVTLSASLASAAVDADSFPLCFVHPSPTSTSSRVIGTTGSLATRPFALTPLTLATTSSKNDNRRDDRKYSRRFSKRIPRRHEEVVGITTGLSLWGELRWRIIRQRRKRLRDRWNSFQSKQSGVRRRRLASRFQKNL